MSNSARQLAGFLREAVFFECPLRIAGFAHRVLRVEESSRMDREEKRLVVIAADGAPPSHALAGRLEFRDRVCAFETTFEAGSPGEWRGPIPDSVKIEPGPTRLTDAERVWAIFSRSGAVSTDYLRFLAPARKQILQGFEDRAQTPGLMRCFDRDASGEICTYSAYFHLKNSLWLACDLASSGSSPAQTQIYMRRSLGKLWEQMADDDTLWFLFTVGHTFWKKFENYMTEGAGQSIIVGDHVCYYARTVEAPLPMPAELHPLSPENPEIPRMLEGVDPGLKQVLMPQGSSGSCYPCTVHYWLWDDGRTQLLVYGASTPTGGNITRSLDSAWIVPLRTAEPLTAGLVKQITRAAKGAFERPEQALPAARVVSTPGTTLAEDLLHHPMRSMFFRPQALGFWTGE
ncbi:hypothetical protein K2X33_12650 [bacterium]|nr:hypothetical protein [bacterium]